MSLFQFLLAMLAASLTLMFLLWLVSITKRDASIVDPYWGFGFVVLVWLAAAITSHVNPHSILIIALVTVW